MRRWSRSTRRRRSSECRAAARRPYDSLVTTLALPETYRLLKDTSDSLRHSASLLRAVGVLEYQYRHRSPEYQRSALDLFSGRSVHLFPRRIPDEFFESRRPEGTSSTYIEITYQPEQKPNVEEAYARSIDDLERCGILRPGDRVLTRVDLDIKSAYVIFDEHRQSPLQTLIDYLESRDIYTAGRYGRWDYYSMEDSIRSGKAIAEKIAPEVQAATLAR